MKTNDPYLIEARLAETLPGLPIANAGQLPDTIQWMPPGRHTITASQGDKAVTRTITVDAAAAQRMNALLQELCAAAAAGTEDKPYFDFNHDDNAASANPVEFTWGGNDPKTGGILAKVEWSEPGKQALLGRAYRRFSPSFYPNAAGEVVGAPINMGGLVNRAAFKNITPIVAKPGDSEYIMDPITPAALAAIQNEVIELKAKLAKAESTEALKAKEAELTALKAELATAKASLATQAKASAKAIVDAAVAAGKLPAQNTALHAKWVDAITLDPGIAETLNAMAPNPALAQVIDGKGSSGGGAAPSGEHEFIVKAKAHAAAAKIDDATAMAFIAAKQPALYAQYREQFGEKPEKK